MKNRFKPLATGLLAAAVAVAACAPAGAPAPNADDAGEAQIVASSGFVCPAADPKVEVTSTELNLFVWTEYIPQDMLECFEKVYGV
ncbi:MAG TPA: hypothetical protein PK954_12430, partial [Anaerolineales bacterium]|nr:hypothetical protein [Anaerolineales bacterium]